MQPIPSKCRLCANYVESQWDDDQEKFFFYCKAYPDGQGIPNAIFMGKQTHNIPRPGQVGIFVFTALTENDII